MAGNVLIGVCNTSLATALAADKIPVVAQVRQTQLKLAGVNYQFDFESYTLLKITGELLPELFNFSFRPFHLRTANSRTNISRQEFLQYLRRVAVSRP